MDYSAAITDGIRRWDEATSNELGAVEEVGNREAADFVINYRASSPAGASARTFHVTGAPFLADGEISYNSLAMEELKDVNTLIRAYGHDNS